MIEYMVKPMVGIGPVLLGMTRPESRHAMGQEPESFKKSPDACCLTDAYHDGAFQVFFDGQDKVEYIELSGPSPGFAALYKGIDVHRSKATEVVALISKDSSFDQDDPELGYSYIFHSLQLSLWRPVVPEDDQDQEGQFFATIGVGKHGYYCKD